MSARVNKKTFSVLSNPEFLAEGTAINDLLNPDRVLIGGEDELAIEKLKFSVLFFSENRNPNHMLISFSKLARFSGHSLDNENSSSGYQKFFHGFAFLIRLAF